jgi:hypothetical protein
MTTATEAPTAAASLASLRGQSQALEAERTQLGKKRRELENIVRQASESLPLSEKVKRLLSGATVAKVEAAVLELERLDRREASLDEAREQVDAALRPLERQDEVDRLEPLFRKAEAFIAKRAAAQDALEVVMKEAAAALWAFDEAAASVTGSVSWWALTHKHGISLSFNPDQLELLRMWRSDYIHEETSPQSSPERIRDAQYVSPTTLERWRERAAELGVKLEEPAAWPDRSRGYFSLRKPAAGATAWVRLRRILADARGTGNPDQLLRVSGAEAADLIASGSAVEASAREADQQLRQFVRDVDAGRRDANAEPPAKDHLVAAAAPSYDEHDDWTPSV